MGMVRRVLFEVTKATDGDFQVQAHEAMAELGGLIAERTNQDKLNAANGVFEASNGCTIRWEAFQVPIEQVTMS